jgi:hypothetical protein
MVVKRMYRLPITSVALVILLYASGVQAVTINSTWICGTGSYSTATCWDPLLALAPYNRGALTFDVNIPIDNITITMDLVVAPSQVNSFLLGTDKAIADQPAIFKVLEKKSYSVLDLACIYGLIWCNGGVFIAPKGSFCGNKAQVWADGGATVEIGAPSYSSTGLWKDTTNTTSARTTEWALFSSSGQGTMLDLSALNKIDAGFSYSDTHDNDTNIQKITASGGGIVDLSGVVEVVGPVVVFDRLDILADKGSQIRLTKLRDITRGGNGSVLFDLSGADLSLPAIQTMQDVQFSLHDGATLATQPTGGSATYSSTGLWKDTTNTTSARTTEWALFSSSGQGTMLDLSALNKIDAGFSYLDTHDNDTNIQKITASGGGTIDLSGVATIVPPARNRDRVEFYIEGENSLIDLSSLQSTGSGTGSVKFILSEGGTLRLGSLSGNPDGGRNTTIALNDPNDLLEAPGDFALGIVTVSNPGTAKLALGGDFTYAHKDETKAPFGKSYVFFNGDGPQEVEVGGLDVDVFVGELANDNLGFGRMVIGEPNKATTVFLVDRIDNGNRGGFTGLEEALYLFGKKADPNDPNDGLRIRPGSILYMGGLPVYAALNGVITDLRTLFKPGEVMIPFDQGYLCLGKPDVNDPQNLVCNGGFETGKNPPTAGNCTRTLLEESNDIGCWVVAQNTINWTHESCFADAGPGERIADLSSKMTAPEGSTEGHVQAISQVIQTVPGTLYHVWFDVAVNPCAPAKGDTGKRSLTVSAAGTSEKLVFDSVTQVNWQTRTWRFKATDTTTTLTFTGQDEPTTGCGVAIDNVIVLRWWPRTCTPTLDLSVTRWGKVEVSPDGLDPNTVQGPGEETFSFPCGQQVALTALPDPNRILAEWVGLTPSEVNEQDPNQAKLIMDQDKAVQAVFGDLKVQIGDIDTSASPTVQATVMVNRIDGKPVTGLDVSDFNVYEDGAAMAFDVQVRPWCVAVSSVLDYSSSMGDIPEDPWDTSVPIGAMQVAARVLVNEMADQDRGEVIKFALGVETTQEYTSDTDALIKAITARPDLDRGATYLYNAICTAVSDTAAQSCRSKAVVVLTDGADTGSRDCDEDGVISSAKLAGIPVFTIGLGYQINETVLSRIAEGTGGKYYHAPEPKDLKSIYEEISGILSGQYVITYESTSCAGGIGDNGEHMLKVTVNVNSGESFGLGKKQFTCSQAQAK